MPFPALLAVAWPLLVDIEETVTKPAAFTVVGRIKLFGEAIMARTVGLICNPTSAVRLLARGLPLIDPYPVAEL